MRYLSQFSVGAQAGNYQFNMPYGRIVAIEYGEMSARVLRFFVETDTPTKNLVQRVVIVNGNSSPDGLDISDNLEFVGAASVPPGNHYGVMAYTTFLVYREVLEW